MMGLTQREKDDALEEAIKKREIPAIIRAIKRGAALNLVVDRYDARTIFHYALSQLTTDQMKELLPVMLRHGLDFQEQIKTNCVLCHALRTGNVEMAQLLFENGAPANQTGKYGETALKLSLERREWDFAKKLIEAGALKGESGKKPHLAVAIRNAAPGDILAELICHEWQEGAWLEKGATPLHVAAECNNVMAMKLVLAQAGGAYVNTIDDSEHKRTPLHHAAARGAAEAIEHLLTSRAIQDAPDAQGVTPLSMVVISGSEGAVGTFLEHMDPDVFAKSHARSMVVAAATGNCKILNLLIAAGGNVNAVDENTGTTPLMAAAAGGKAEAVELLLEHKADVYCRDKGELTAYGHALARKHAPIINRLSEFKQPGDIKPFDTTRDDQTYKRTGIYILEVTGNEGSLKTIFNFWTQQVIHTLDKSSSGGGIFVQNFRDVQRQQVIEDARNQLISLGGNPPELDGNTKMDKPVIAARGAQP